MALSLAGNEPRDGHRRTALATSPRVEALARLDPFDIDDRCLFVAESRIRATDGVVSAPPNIPIDAATKSAEST